MHVDYMNMRDGQGSGVSSGQRVDRNPEMHAIFSQGFEFSLNLDDGSVKEFSALNKPVWQALLAERGAELEQELKSSLAHLPSLAPYPPKRGRSSRFLPIKATPMPSLLYCKSLILMC